MKDDIRIAAAVNEIREERRIDAILAERGNRYGRFCDHARVTQAIKRAMQDSPNWQSLSDTHKETLDMVAHKIGRMLCGDPNYDDNVVDIIGYSQLLLDELTGSVRR